MLNELYTAAPHFHWILTPGVLAENAPCQFTGLMPPGNPGAGTMNARPDEKISSLPLIGTVVCQVMVVVSKKVLAQEAEEEKVMTAFGTARL